MKRDYVYILIAALLLAVSCKESPKISSQDMAEIYAEMLVRDQWINSNISYRSLADTTMVYGTILEKYGYTKEDYTSSVDYYVRNPKVFGTVLENTISILDTRIKKLDSEIQIRDSFVEDSLKRAERKAHIAAIIAKVKVRKWEERTEIVEKEIGYGLEDSLFRKFRIDSIPLSHLPDTTGCSDSDTVNASLDSVSFHIPDTSLVGEKPLGIPAVVAAKAAIQSDTLNVRHKIR